MNKRTTFTLLAVLTAVVTMSVSSAYALEQACPDCEEQPSKVTAKQILTDEVPVTVWTDKSKYTQGETIMVEGKVANIASGFPVTVTVISPTNNIVSIDQVTVNSDASYMTSFNTAGSLWKYDGTYTVKVQYGHSEKSNKVKVELTGGIPKGKPTTPTGACGSSEITVSGKCIPFSITGGVITGASINTNDNSILFRIQSTDDGTVTLTPSKDVLNGIFMVLVDGQQWDDVMIEGQKVTVMFPAGTESVELIGTFVIPEFGTIAALILAVAIISIVAVSAKSRLSIIPRY
ncbi:MAG: PEFG-CTERM sorting domain-containing protein [Nitrosopumilaceae archaeon]|nr:PEFG-CTERM sorting domain-containing protein [Nitrosopumilaceae archaeon]